jgi:hypothetical protein
VVYKARSLVVDADVSQAMPSTVELRTGEKPLQASGAKLKLISADRYELMIDPVIDPVVTADTNHANSNANPRPAPGYRHIEMVVNFAGREGK